jgi:uncharacterized protein
VTKGLVLYRDVLLDTGPLVAIYCKADQRHEACAQVLKQITPPLLTTWPVLTEAAWILRNEPKALERLYNPRGLFTIVPQDDAALGAFGDAFQRYRKLGPQLADLSLLHVAETQGLSKVFTLDRRDFVVYRVKKRRLQLLPESL